MKAENILLTKSKMLTTFAFSVISGLVVLFTGFVPMFIFWNCSKSPQNLKGFYDYYAASWGDGIFLVFLTGSASFLIKSFEKIITASFKQKFFKGPFLFAVLGAIIGVCVQITWLINPKIGLNWTLPKPHFFTLAGWWHAAFFVFMCAVVSYCLKTLYIILKKTEIHSWENTQKFAFYIFMLSGTLYVCMNAFDDHMIDNNFILTSSVAIITVSILFCVILLCTKKIQFFYKSIINCIIAAFCISLCIYTGINLDSLTFSLIAAAFSTILEKVYVNNIKDFSLKFIPRTISLFFIFSATFFLNNFLKIDYIIFIPFFLLLVKSLITEKHSQDHFKRIILYIEFIALVLIIYIHKTNIFNLDNILSTINSNAANFFLALFSFLIGRVLTKYIKYLYKFSQVAEETNNHVYTARVEIYIRIFIIVIGVFIYILNIFTIIYSNTNINYSLDICSVDEVTILLLILICFAFIIFFSLVKKSRIVFNVANILLSSMSYLLINALLFKYIDISKITSFPTVIFIFAIVTSLCVTIILPYIISRGFCSNMFDINGIPKTIEIKVTILIIYVGSLSSIFLTVLTMFSSKPGSISINKFVICLMTFFLIIFVLPLLNSLSYLKIKNTNKSQVVSTASIHGVLQDGFTFFILTIVIFWLPFFVYGLLPNINGQFFIIGLLIEVSWALLYALENNVKHYNEVYNNHKHNKNLKRQLLALKSHLQMQNYCCIIITMPYVLLPIAKDLWDNLWENHSFSDWRMKYFLEDNLNIKNNKKS